MPEGKPRLGETELEKPAEARPSIQIGRVYRPFGPLLKELRRSRELTLEKVARAVNSHKGYISGIENGKTRPPSPRFVSKFARFYKVDEKELLRLAYAEKAPTLIREEVIRALWPAIASERGESTPQPSGT